MMGDRSYFIRRLYLIIGTGCLVRELKIAKCWNGTAQLHLQRKYQLRRDTSKARLAAMHATGMLLTVCVPGVGWTVSAKR